MATLAAGPTRPFNYASCVMCRISQEGGRLVEFSQRPLLLEHVKLSSSEVQMADLSRRSLWDFCILLSTYLPPSAALAHLLMSTVAEGPNLYFS